MLSAPPLKYLLALSLLLVLISASAAQALIMSGLAYYYTHLPNHQDSTLPYLSSSPTEMFLDAVLSL